MITIKFVPIVSFSILLIIASCQQGEKEATPAGLIPKGLTGDYLGQAPPGDSAVLFAPVIISTGMASRDMAISPDSNEIYFGVTPGAYSSTIAVCKRENGTWTGPGIASFCKDPGIIYFEPCFSPDGNRLYFLSTLVDADGVEGDNWSGPMNMGPEVNSEAAREWSPYVTHDGKFLFFMSNRLVLPQGVWDYKKFAAMHGQPGNGNSNIYWISAGLINELRERAEFR